MTLLQTIWQRDGERVVAFGPDGEVTLAELRLGSQQLARAMARLAGPDRPSMRWALCFDDSLLFAQALLACALGGHRAILPGHQRLTGLQALQSQFDGLLTDGELPGSALTAAQLRLPLLVADDELDADGAALPPERLSLTLFSSGSTGEPKAIPKDWPQLEAELRVQMALWGERLAGTGCWPASVTSTSTACCFAFCCRSASVSPLIAAASTTRSSWRCKRPLVPDRFSCVSEPARPGHCCRRLPADRLLRRSPATGRCPAGQTAVRSAAGGDLRQQRDRRHRLAPAPPGTDPWMTLPGVEVRVGPDQGLLLRSPFLPTAGGSSAPIASPCTRAVSSCWAARIGWSSWRRSASPSTRWRAPAGAGGGGSSRRAAAATGPAPDPRRCAGAEQVGVARWAELGPGRFLLALRQHASWLEPVALPRSVRRVEQMPVNAQGKRPWPQLRSCSMSLSVDSLPANTLPTVLDCETLADGVCLQLRLDPALPWFAGHFPVRPCCRGDPDPLGDALCRQPAQAGAAISRGGSAQVPAPPAPRGRVQPAPAVAGGQGPAPLSVPARR